MLISILSSIFFSIFLFQLLTWLKIHLFSEKYNYFSSGSFSFVWMLGMIILLIIGSFSLFILKKGLYAGVSIFLLLLLSLSCVSSYKGVTDAGLEIHRFFLWTEKIEWNSISKIHTDYRLNESKGTFYPIFTITYDQNETEALDDWENIVSTKKHKWLDFSASGWVNSEQDRSIIRLNEVKLMVFVYEHASTKLYCIQRGFISDKPKNQIEPWDLFAKHFIDKPNCQFI
jgi:hypothetical protein